MENEKRLDLIDRKKLIAEYDRVHIGPAGGARKLMEDAPTVDAAPVVYSYWIDSKTVDHTGRITGHGIDCSVCDSVFKNERRDVVQHWKEKFKVCPFCGAIMDGGNEDV